MAGMLVYPTQRQRQRAVAVVVECQDEPGVFQGFALPCGCHSVSEETEYYHSTARGTQSWCQVELVRWICGGYYHG